MRALARSLARSLARMLCPPARLLSSGSSRASRLLALAFALAAWGKFVVACRSPFPCSLLALALGSGFWLLLLALAFGSSLALAWALAWSLLCLLDGCVASPQHPLAESGRLYRSTLLAESGRLIRSTLLAESGRL